MSNTISLSSDNDEKMPEDHIALLNLDIRQILIDILTADTSDLQIEIANLVELIHRINRLIYKPQKTRIIFPSKTPQDLTELTLLLEEIRDIFLSIKKGGIALNTVEVFRRNIEKEINNYQYKLGGFFINTILYIRHIQSTPFKIFLGLSTSTLIAVFFLHTSLDNLIWVSSTIPNTKISQNTPNQSNSNKSFIFPQNPSFNPEQSNQIIVSPQTTSRNLSISLMHAALAGALGSIASILLRIVQFQGQTYEDPIMPFLVGLLKPLIGLIIGIFVFCIIQSSAIIKIDTIFTENSPNDNFVEGEVHYHFLIFSCAFIFGFSERFASDLITKGESEIMK